MFVCYLEYPCSAHNEGKASRKVRSQYFHEHGNVIEHISKKSNWELKNKQNSSGFPVVTGMTCLTHLSHTSIFLLQSPAYSWKKTKKLTLNIISIRTKANSKSQCCIYEKRLANGIEGNTDRITSLNFLKALNFMHFKKKLSSVATVVESKVFAFAHWVRSSHISLTLSAKRRGFFPTCQSHLQGDTFVCY